MAETPRDPAEFVLVMTTVPDRDTGERLVRQVVEDRFAACGNLVGGVTSVYRWKGELETADEVLVLLKTRKALVSEVFERVAELHPYEVPELVALPIDAISNTYSRWVREETTGVIA